MGYIHDIGKETEERLAALEEAWKEGTVEECDKQRYELVKFVKEKVLESYKNALKADKKEQETSAPRAPQKPVRNYKK